MEYSHNNWYKKWGQTTFLSLLSVPAYYTLMGMGHVRHNLASHIVQSAINVAMVLTSILLRSTVLLGTVVFSTSAGMGVSTVYLIWRKQKAFKRVSREGLTASVNSDGTNRLICKHARQKC